jgi:formylglycine-generating enzyme required for sulfatase activity
MFPDWAKSVERLVEAIGPSPRPFRDAPWCPELVVIPPGEFMMGSTQPERQWAMEHGAERWADWEKPQHRVKIEAPFAAGRYLVTFEEYDHFAQVDFRAPPGDQGGDVVGSR